MKSQVINHFGDYSVFEPAEMIKPKIKPGYVLIRVKATSVNPIDYKLRAGNFPKITAEFPAVLHGDVAGIVEEVGSGVTEFKVGDEVVSCLLVQGHLLLVCLNLDVTCRNSPFYNDGYSILLCKDRLSSHSNPNQPSSKPTLSLILYMCRLKLHRYFLFQHHHRQLDVHTH